MTGEHEFSYSRTEGDKGFSDKDFFERPYLWMQSQLKKKINNYSGDLPVWAWKSYANRVNIEKRFGKDQVKIIADIPLNRCLISDFDLYEHGVLNKSYISYDTKLMEQQYECINEKEYHKDRSVELLYKFTPTQEELEKSWEMIFDLHKPPTKFEDYLLPSKEGRYLQICVDRIYSQEIKKIKIYP